MLVPLDLALISYHLRSVDRADPRSDERSIDTVDGITVPTDSGDVTAFDAALALWGDLGSR